jgi:hypothetical protein
MRAPESRPAESPPGQVGWRLICPPAVACAFTRKQRRPRSCRTLAELSKCRGPANARDACREASDEQAPEQGTPSRFGERSSEPAARSAPTSRGSAPTTTSGGEYYPPLGGVAAIARESAEGPVRAGANPVSQPSRVCALGNPLQTRPWDPILRVDALGAPPAVARIGATGGGGDLSPAPPP